MTILELRGVSKGFGNGVERINVLRDIDLAIEDGEFVAILGFSGSGKTTLMNMIAGLTRPDRGEIFFKQQPVTDAGPDRAVVFQNYSLMPWLSVYENVALSVDSTFKSDGQTERDARIRNYVDMVGLTPAIDRKPAELSGGMRQRVAVARALAMKPEILLLDEPFSALDALTRSKLQDGLQAIWERERTSVILITNDVDEAILLADRIIPLKPGPNAALGPEFKVDLPRSNDRTAINRDKGVKQLRNDIIRYLVDLGTAHENAQDQGSSSLTATPTAKPKSTSTDDKEDHSAKGNEPFLRFQDLTKIYPTPRGPLTVVEDFGLVMKRGEFVSLIGHSGCGKSTVLAMAAGLTESSSGEIILDGGEIRTAGPDKGVVFQSPSLLPWLTAYENVALGVSKVFAHVSRKEQDDIIRYYLTRVGLGQLMNKRASDLSNGMQQRVGIARAFAISPKLLLLDEPFGMLDNLTRWSLQEVLLEIWSRTKVTAICVTHDVDEAILLADRVAMMTNGPRARVGKIINVDLPRPRTRSALLEHPDYYRYREELLSFLEDCEMTHAAATDPSTPPTKAA